MLLSASLSAQEKIPVWARNPFDQDNFIENRGQFTEKDNAGKGAILYAAREKGTDMFFTSSGVVFRHLEMPPLTESQREKAEEKAKKYRDKKIGAEDILPKPEPHYLAVSWTGANPAAEILAGEEVNNYYSYSNLSDKSGKSSLKANAFKKLTYKNIYNHVDIEYLFPDGKEGIKYNIILYPGANPGDIKMQYTGAKDITAGREGNLRIKSSFGYFTDHAPVVYDESGKRITASFTVKKHTVSFHLENYDARKTVTVDPWMTTPTFAGTNRAYDIDWDFQGNVYIYGGQAPFQLVKLDNAGTILWTFTGSALTSYWYGDFAVDRLSGTSYLTEGFSPGPGAAMLKVYTSGQQGTLFTGNSSIEEMWRVAYNSCTHQGVLGCGSTSSTFQAATFDTTIASIAPVNVLSSIQEKHDISLLALDDTNCYMATSRTNAGNLNYDNIIVKCPANTLSPLAYTVSDGYSFYEAGSITYTSANGFNGMAKGSMHLYTYDGITLKKWDPWSGALLGSISVANGNMFACGGITVDLCDNVFVGTTTGVSQYDTSLSLVSSAAAPGIVYDVAAGANGEILACGDGFVSALSMFVSCTPPPSFTLTTSSTASTCAGNDGTATASVSGGTPPFSYFWMPGGQTDSTATGLAPGTYTVIAYESSGAGCSASAIGMDTIAVTASSGFTQQSHSSTGISCYGSADGTATVNVSGGTQPLTFLWSPGGQTTQTATGLIPGTYTVTVKDFSGCQTIDSMVVPGAANPLNVIPYVYDIPCDTSYGNYGYIALSVSGGTSPYNFLWSTGDTVQDLFNIYTPGLYSVHVADANGCPYDTSFTLIAPPATIWTSTTFPKNICIGDSIHFIYGINGDTSSINQLYRDFGDTTYFYWDDFTSPWNDTLLNAAHLYTVPGTYYVYFEMYHNNYVCYEYFFDTITVNTPPVVNIGNDTSLCSGSVMLDAGNPGSLYQWSTGDSSRVITVSASGTYWVSDSAGGCVSADTIMISYLPVSADLGKDTTFCGSSYLLDPGISGVNFLWSTGGSLPALTVTSTGTYWLLVSNAVCSDTDSVTVTINSFPGADAGNNQTITQGASVTLTATGGTSYVWTPSSGLKPDTGAAVIASPDTTTTYYVSVSDSNGCTSVDSVTITVEKRCGHVFVPSAFSPNDDNQNDVLYVRAECVRDLFFAVYDRWGEEVFKTTDITKGWDGKLRGKPMQNDVFVFYLKISYSTGGQDVKKGNITLVR